MHNGLLLFICILLAGCAGRFTNRPATALMIDKYFVDSWEVNKPLDEIRQNIMFYNMNCGGIPIPVAYPTDQTKALATVNYPGFTDTCVIMAAKFEEVTPRQTKISIWNDYKETYWAELYRAALQGECKK